MCSFSAKLSVGWLRWCLGGSQDEVVLQEAEMSVRRLLTSLDQQRSSFSLEGDLNDVLRTVQNLNAACRTGPQV